MAPAMDNMGMELVMEAARASARAFARAARGVMGGLDTDVDTGAGAAAGSGESGAGSGEDGGGREAGSIGAVGSKVNGDGDEMSDVLPHASSEKEEGEPQLSSPGEPASWATRTTRFIDG